MYPAQNSTFGDHTPVRLARVKYALLVAHLRKEHENSTEQIARINVVWRPICKKKKLYSARLIVCSDARCVSRAGGSV